MTAHQRYIQYRKDELYHYGVPGMHWGHRRYQNKDGSLTPLGRQRQFLLERRRVTNSISNDIPRMQHLPPKKAEVKRRGKLADTEAEMCIKLAIEARRKAKEVEPIITTDVVNAVSSSGSKMYGLENRMKQATSLAAKIGSDAKEDGVSFEKAVSGIRDCIRYTSVSDNNNFVDSYRKTKENLQSLGYQETRCKNFFKMYKNGEVQHKSIQCTYKNPNGYEFEIQFHTPESQTVKELKLPLYNERRRAGLSESRKARLEKEMHELAEQVPYPRGVFDL